jgi:uncharacterized membrane protein (DUF485 family)
MMTEFELASLTLYKAEAVRQQIEIVQNIAASLETKFTGFTTLLFGFVLVAYFAGKNLSKNQVTILTILYLATIAQYVVTYLLAGFGIVFATAQLAELNHEMGTQLANVVDTAARY